jgi:hypothetical protein
VWISLLCGAAERELNIRGHDHGHERVKGVVLRVVAAMMARGVQAGDLACSTGPTRFVPWEEQSPSSALEQVSNRWDVEKWRAIGRYPDPVETGWLSKEKA